MLKNYYEVNENESVGKFLKEFKSKKLSHYIILEGGEYFVNIRNLALSLKNPNEKLKKYKIKLSTSKGKTDLEKLKDLYLSGERVIKTKENNLYDFIDGLKTIENLKFDFLKEKIEDYNKKEVYVIEEGDKISTARKLFIEKRINILPVVDKNLKVIGEVRPIDFLIYNLYDKIYESGFYDKNKEEPVFNLPIENIYNKKPITVSKQSNFKELISIMVDKNLPSLIITDNDEKIYNIVSYKDIFKLIEDMLEKVDFKIEYSGVSNLFPDEFDLIQDFIERTMRKIAKVSDYNLLKLNFKVIGDNNMSSNRKFLITANLSCGNHVINLGKEMKENKDDELDYKKSKWDVILLTQEILKSLERRVIEEKRKEK